MHKKTLFLAILLTFSSQASNSYEKAGAVSGLVISTLALGYAITATVFGSIPEPGQYWGCQRDYSLIFCNSTASGYQCSNTAAEGFSPSCIKQAEMKNPGWAQGMQISGIVLDVIAPISTFMFSVLTYSAFKKSSCASDAMEPSKA